jgi:chromosome segregation ATPase
MSSEPTKPSESLVQQLLTERRELKVALERAKLDVADARGTAAGPDPRVGELQAEIARLRAQLDDTRAEVNLLRTERDELRDGVLRALSEIEKAELEKD